MHHDGFEGRIGERRHPICFLLVAHLRLKFAAAALLLLDIVHQTVEEPGELLGLIAGIDCQAVAEIRLSGDELRQRILDMADAQARPVFGNVEADILGLCRHANGHELVERPEEGIAEAEGPIEIERRPEDLDVKLVEPTARRQPVDGGQKRKRHGACNACKGMHANGTDGVVDLQLFLHILVAEERDDGTERADQKRAAGLEEVAAGRHRDQGAQHAAKRLFRQHDTILLGTDYVTDAGPHPTRQHGVEDDRGDIGIGGER